MSRIVLLLFICLPLVVPRPVLKRDFRLSQKEIKSSNTPTTTPTSRDPYVGVEDVEVRVSD
uniref:Uncharacterized protein n=1 Tax=Pristionchus pacificus TaxID=54126 RepID=A0A2A6C7P3_PRIPA|eukprot:PDM74127.1 hypothetical protein PRIPAC_41483 [Pristionchus pacificus]